MPLEYAGMGAAAVKTTDVIATASRFIGLHKEANNRKLAVFMRKAGFSLNPDVTAWCAAFANAVLHENGIAGTLAEHEKVSKLNLPEEAQEKVIAASHQWFGLL